MEWGRSARRSHASPWGAAAIAGLTLAGHGRVGTTVRPGVRRPGTPPAPGALGAVGGDLAAGLRGQRAEDATENRVVKYDYNGSFVAEFTQPEGLATPFADLNGLGADDRGGVYVVDDGSRVVKMDLGGRHVRTYGAGALTSASDVAGPRTAW